MNNLKTKLLFAAITLIGLTAVITAIRSHILIARLESAVEQTKQSADEQKQRSDELEKQTYIYKEKTAYLEQKLAEIQTAAKQQDETLEKLSADTDAARRDLQRFRHGTK